MRGFPGSTPGCGTLARYRSGCRCDRCRGANARQTNRRRLLRQRGRVLTVDRTGTIRRIRALMALGWPLRHIGARLGCTESALRDLCGRPEAPVHVTIARSVADLYEALCMTPGPSPRTRRHAQLRGWLPPLAWDDIDRDPEPPKVERLDVIDEAAVLRKMRGEVVRVTHAERREAVRRLHRQGLSDGQITRLTGINGRQVLRDRQRLGLPANDMGQVAS